MAVKSKFADRNLWRAVVTRGRRQAVQSLGPFAAAVIGGGVTTATIGGVALGALTTTAIAVTVTAFRVFTGWKAPDDAPVVWQTVDRAASAALGVVLGLGITDWAGIVSTDWATVGIAALAAATIAVLTAASDEKTPNTGETADDETGETDIITALVTVTLFAMVLGIVTYLAWQALKSGAVHTALTWDPVGRTWT